MLNKGCCKLGHVSKTSSVSGLINVSQITEECILTHPPLSLTHLIRLLNRNTGELRIGSSSCSGFTVCRCQESQRGHCCDAGLLPRGPLRCLSIDLPMIEVKSWTLALSCRCHSLHPGWRESRGMSSLCTVFNNFNVLISVPLSVWQTSCLTQDRPNKSECRYCISNCWLETCLFISTEGHEGLSHVTILFDYARSERRERREQRNSSHSES